MTQPSDRLQTRWDAVPAERQAIYRRMYQFEVKKAGASTDDAAELAVLRRLIHAYQEQALVPVGSRWVVVPERVRQAARQAQPLSASDSDRDAQPAQRRLMTIGLFLLLVAGGLLFLLVNLINRNSEDDILSATGTPTLILTPTPRVSPTPTALALAESDRVINAGEKRRDYYPVLLHIYLIPEAESRVFVVQARPVETADWRYDPNPEVASWISGLLVRPVLGLPFSEDNLRLMQMLGPDARFALQMNTGARLEFAYAETLQPTRQDTALFAQSAPGLALVLIGETDAEGLPTARRWWVLADYQPGQEIERLLLTEDDTANSTGTTLTLIGSDGVQAQLMSVAVRRSADLPPDQMMVQLDLSITTRMTAFLTGGWSWSLDDGQGQRILFNPASPEAAFPAEIPPQTTLDLRLTFPASLTAADGRLIAQSPSGEQTLWVFPLPLPPAPPSLADLEVHIERVAYVDDQLIVQARLINPQTVSIPLIDAPLAIILGDAPSPLGPQLPPIGGELPTEIAAGSALRLQVTFPYSGQVYARLFLLGREYALQLRERR